MKQVLLLTACALVFWLFSFSGLTVLASTPSQSQQKERDEKSMEEQFRKFGRELDELKARASTLSAESKKQMDRLIDDAEKKRKAAGKKLDQFRSEGEKKWGKFEKELKESMDEFEKALERARAHFKE